MIHFIFSIVILALLRPISVLGVECASDNFDSTDSLLANWTCSGERCLDTWKIDSGRLVSYGVEKTLSTLSFSKLVNMSDFDLTLNIEGVEGVDQQVVFRASDDLKTYYMIGFRYHEDNLLTDPGNNIVLYKFVNGNYRLLKRADPSAYANLYAVQHGVLVNAKLSVKGNNIKVFFGQWLVIDFYDDGSIFYPTIQEGDFGLQSWGGDYTGETVMRFDNFMVESDSCPTQLPTSTVTPFPTPTLTLTPTSTSLPTPTAIPSPTNTPTPTPTATPTPTNTPTPVKPKVIFIPGMGASWNSEALVYNKSVPDSGWKMTPFVRNYDSLIKTLENGGYEQGKDLLIWNYDWRRPLGELAGKLDTYINGKVEPDEKVVIIGHSMGGVLGRLWLQNHPTDTRVKQVISAGSPQSGAMDPYTIWSSGRVASGDSVTSTALNILLQLQKDKFDTKVQVLRNYVPSMADLIPVYDFVKKSGKVISHRNITFHNDLLFGANQSVESIYPSYRAIVGVGHSTPIWAILGDRDWIDKILGYWPDGSLKGYIKGDGDGTVKVGSQYFENDPEYRVESGHGEVVDNGLTEIAGVVGIGNTVMVPGIDLKSSRLYFIGSPAVIKAKCEGTSEYKSDEMGFLLLDGDDKNCKVYIEGLADGTYHLVTGVVGDEHSWNYFEKETSSGKIDIITENDSNGTSRKFILESVRRDLKKIGLGKYEKTLDKGGVLGVLEGVLKYRRKYSETAVTTRLIVSLEEIVDKNDLLHKSVFHINRWNVLPNKKLTIVDALNIELAKKYMTEAKQLLEQKNYWDALRKIVMANMLVSIR